MESNKFNADNLTFSGSVNASTNPTPSNVPRDGSTTERMVGSILSEIHKVQATYEKLGHSYCALSSANPGSGERIPDVANSSTQTMIPDGGILSLIQERQAVYKELRHRLGAIFSANAATGERMTDVVNSSTQTLIPEREGDLEEDEDDGQDLNMESMCSEDDYLNWQELAKIDCGHVYHVDCIKEWIKIKNSCPICKRDALAVLT